jgi:hypothetical protein
MLIQKLRTMFGSAGLLACFALILPVSSGCGEREDTGLTKKSITLTDLPKPVSDAAAKRLKGVKLSDVWENFDQSGKLVSYEIRGQVPSTGKIKEVRVSTSGEILEEE